MTRFWLVRHGPTHQKAFTGWRDVPADLSDKAAIAGLDAYLPDDALLTSSDLSRSIATADAIARGRQRVTPDPRLREFDFGEWDGLTFAEVDARDSALCRDYWEKPGDVAPPGGESWNQVSERVTAGLIDLSVGHSWQNIIIVGHMGMIMTMIAKCGGTPYQAMGHQIDNLSVTDMTFGPEGWQIGTINHRP